MSVSFCLHHHVAVSAFIICRGLCACTEMLLMCVLYVSFGSRVRPRTFGCVAMGSSVLFILRSKSARIFRRVWSEQIVWMEKALCRYGCMHFLAALEVVGDVICVVHDRCSGWL